MLILQGIAISIFILFKHFPLALARLGEKFSPALLILMQLIDMDDHVGGLAEEFCIRTIARSRARLCKALAGIRFFFVFDRVAVSERLD